MASLVPRERWDQNAPVLPLTDGVLEMAEAENGDTRPPLTEFPSSPSLGSRGRVTPGTYLYPAGIPHAKVGPF